MTFAHPLALTLLVLLVPLAVLATRAKVPIHGTQRTLAFALLGLAWAALVLALADPLVSRSPRTTRVVVLASAKELTSAARERAEREAAAWRDRVPHADPFLVREAGADLAGACKTAMAEIPAGTPGELLVLGPARGFRSNLAPILQLATARNIVVHARESTASSALRLLEVRHASAAREHEPVRWIATIESSEVRTAKLEVWQGQDRLASRDLKLTPGVSLHQLEVTPRGGGVVILTTTVVGPDSTDAVHCTERSALLVEGRPTVLHLATDPRRSAALAATLAPFGLDVTPANPGALDEASVDSAQVLIVDDVPQSLWSEALQQKVKDRVERQGLGLLVAGARAGAATGGYAKSPWSGLLPIEPIARSPFRGFDVPVQPVQPQPSMIAAPVRCSKTRCISTGIGAPPTRQMRRELMS